MEEAKSLVDALDIGTIETLVVPVSRVDAGRFFGSGKTSEIADLIRDNEIGLVVANTQLSPVQQRNLERAWGSKVLDRTALILEIFGDRAKTREGVLQVDLAHLTYQRSRLVRSWTHLERQRGGRGFMGGPGETQIEADRRAIDDAMVRLKRRLEKFVRTRDLHRSSRKQVPFPIVALVGYTNAGKSTIFNAMTGSDVMAKDMVFATLDPTMRALEVTSGRKLILSDTVGFITDLPTELVAAFRATLEEVRDADVILHVRDISHEETELQNIEVARILNDLEAGPEFGQPMIEVWNKTDLLQREEREAAALRAGRHDNVVLASAKNGDGLEAILGALEAELRKASIPERIAIPLAAGQARSWLYAARLVDHEAVREDRVELDVNWDPAERGRFYARFGADISALEKAAE